jgi:hypothetical protein
MASVRVSLVCALSINGKNNTEINKINEGMKE